jgi:hypothetical protein
VTEPKNPPQAKELEHHAAASIPAAAEAAQHVH